MTTPSNDTELMRVIGRIEGKIDGMMTSMTGLHAEHKELKSETNDLWAQVNKLENRLNLYAGGLAVLSPVAFMVLKPLIDRIIG